ncbi:hypothetical protein EDC94DRAFT_609616 [Helicostylum pulchrum]|uniref:C2H2-type domain-containing protein n=1 Tax=Helicostylum pulchrum TaxID=562976 RepID=A0ABP9Y6B1_9FUNG|nr:hypothetical protein EDC94DRAFT_609616 [Helicostylum pulchrum]
MNDNNSPPLDTKLPTPISPTTTVHFGSLISQFSIKDNSTSESSTNKLFGCPDCSQVFNRAHNLKSHRATHSASKPFQCTDCEKQFLRLHDLKRHQKLHTGERPYHCPVCKRSFSRLDALNRHRKTEGGSACLKTSSSSTSPSMPVKKQESIPPLFIPSMTSQWQVNATLPSFITKPNPYANSPPPPPPSLPSLILPLNNNSSTNELVEDLRLKIHDLEIENRVLRSLLCNESAAKKTEDETLDFKRQKRST